MRVLAALWKYITRATPDDPEVDPWWYLPPAPLDTDPEPEMTKIPDDCLFDEDRELPDREDLRLGLALPATVPFVAKTIHYCPRETRGIDTATRERDLARLREIDARRYAAERAHRERIIAQRGLAGDCEIDCMPTNVCQGLCGA